DLPLAELLGTPTVVIPPHPGILSALGLLSTDLQHDAMRTFLQRGPDYDLEAMEEVYRTLHDEAATALTAEGIPAARQAFRRQADLRYAKQGFELTVDFPGDEVSKETVQAVIAAFHQRHEQLYTYAAPDTPVEIVNLRLHAVGQMDKPDLAAIEAVSRHTRPEASQSRSVYFSELGFVETPIFSRYDLRAGHTFSGPAIVEQLDTTIVVYPGFEAVVDDYGTILMTREMGGERS
ncbi:MAG: hypothetical protein K0U66_05400, partial [Gammaproteobacteria bacterium]|nr:hypothetical protein [Gammaproteobacteria bacterium]